MRLMEKNPLREKLQQGKKLIGCQLRSHSVMIAELMGYCGYDYIFIDNEHFPCNMETNEQIIRAVELAGACPILRIADGNPSVILQYLDLGVMGLIIPHIDSGDDAHSIVSAAKYRPLGRRGFSNASRATRYGALPMAEYRQMANQNTWIIPMIESKAAVENIAEILGAGVDAIHIGQMDLSESYGFGGEQDHAEVQEAIDHVIARARSKGVPVAFPVQTPQDAEIMIRRGINMISLSSEMVQLSRILHQNLSDLQSRIEALDQNADSKARTDAAVTSPERSAERR